MASAYPIVLWKNLLATYGVAAITSEATGYLKANLYDYRQFTTWRSTSTATQNIDIDMGAALATAADGLFIAGHNLGSKTATLTLTSTASSDYTSGAATLLTKAFTSDDPYYTDITSSTSRYWRAAITSIDSNYAEIGELWISPKYTFPVLPTDGWKPFPQRGRGRVLRSVGGNLLGSATQARDLSWQSSLRYVTQTQAETYRDFFQQHAYKLLPFVFVPDNTNYAGKAELVTLPDEPELLITQEGTKYHVDFQYQGLVNANQ